VNNLHIITLYKLHNQHNQASRACRARRVERVEPCCSASSTQPKCMGSTRRTCWIVSYRDMTSQVEFELYSSTTIITCRHCSVGLFV